MKKTILSFSLIILLIIGAFLVTGKNETVSKKSHMLYEGDGFSVKYPKNWTVHSEDRSHMAATFDLPGEGPNPYSPEQGEGTNPFDDIDVRVQKFENLQEFFKQELITEEKPVMINDIAGYTFLESGMVMYRYYLFPLKENNYLLFVTPEDEKNSQALEKILKTLTVDPWIGK